MCRSLCGRLSIKRDLSRTGLGLLLILSLVSISRSAELAAQLYEKSAPSVFFISVGKGQPISFGSGFLIAKNMLVTNAHVVEGGDCFVEEGSVRIPATVEKRDSANDLAIIKVAVEISATPLTLSKKKPIPGENVYAIGNPEGLEKSISTGVVAGIRELDRRELIQITAPISHGSSGGPVLDSAGEVIGITVSMLKDGQNLNFAVPVQALRQLMVRTDSEAQVDVPFEKQATSDFRRIRWGMNRSDIKLIEGSPDEDASDQLRYLGKNVGGHTAKVFYVFQEEGLVAVLISLSADPDHADLYKVALRDWIPSLKRKYGVPENDTPDSDDSATRVTLKWTTARSKIALFATLEVGHNSLEIFAAESRYHGAIIRRYDNDF
jgi:hypothetical protein